MASADPRPPSLTSRLWQQCQTQAEGRSWMELLLRVRPRVEARCRATGLQAADIEDVFGEVQLRLFRARDSFDGERGTFHGWLSALIRHAIVDSRGRGEAAALAEDQLVEARAGALTELIEQEMQQQVDRALQAARDEDGRGWEIYRRSALERQPAREVADALGMTVAAVYQAKSRFERRVKELALGDSEGG